MNEKEVKLINELDIILSAIKGEGKTPIFKELIKSLQKELAKYLVI